MNAAASGRLAMLAPAANTIRPDAKMSPSITHTRAYANTATKTIGAIARTAIATCTSAEKTCGKDTSVR